MLRVSRALLRPVVSQAGSGRMNCFGISLPRWNALLPSLHPNEGFYLNLWWDLPDWGTEIQHELLWGGPHTHTTQMGIAECRKYGTVKILRGFSGR